tara:strand:+ start:733 stop:936 length:204 start_codon:yes stop_codon:yes gene_type:complete
VQLQGNWPTRIADARHPSGRESEAILLLLAIAIQPRRSEASPEEVDTVRTGGVTGPRGWQAFDDLHV